MSNSFHFIHTFPNPFRYKLGFVRWSIVINHRRNTAPPPPVWAVPVTITYKFLVIVTVHSLERKCAAAVKTGQCVSGLLRSDNNIPLCFPLRAAILDSHTRAVVYCLCAWSSANSFLLVTNYSSRTQVFHGSFVAVSHSYDL